MTTPLLAAFIGGWEIMLLATMALGMAIWIRSYVTTSDEEGD